jgi:hypothetical protein
MWFFSSVAAFAMAATLSWAALEKMRNLSSLTGTIRLLGSPVWLSRPAAVLLVMAEVGIVIGILYDRNSVWIQGSVAGIATLFAAAGMRAWWIGKPIRCSCFGTGSWSALGLKQVVTLPVWLFGVWLLTVQDHTPSLQLTAAQFAAVGLCLAALRVPTLLLAQRQAYGDRRSAQETYQWLR